MAQPLSEFISDCDAKYRTALTEIPLFKFGEIEWTKEQKQQFCLVFYHLRGHFHDFLWIMGNFAPDKSSKDVVLSNISEEFGKGKNSHEQWYINFSASLGVDIIEEIITEEHYLPFARSFNKEHTNWLLKHSWNEKQSAFSAYERLDNIDYPFLLNHAKRNLGITEKKDLIFFYVHTNVTHFDATEPLLSSIWESDPESVKSGFNFIYNHQLNMWNQLSSHILG